MERGLSHAELEELLGAYALDAVDGEERELVELHLLDCPRCRAEVAEHRAVASFLGSAGVLGPRPRLAAFTVNRDAWGFAVTEERAGGVKSTDKPPVVLGRITRA